LNAHIFLAVKSARNFVCGRKNVSNGFLSSES